MTLPAGAAMTLENGAQIAGGCVILEGTSLALVAEHPHGRRIVVVALASGRVLQSVAVPQGKVRIAARRGVAVVQDAARHLVVVDLKFGRQVGAMMTRTMSPTWRSSSSTCSKAASGSRTPARSCRR